MFLVDAIGEPTQGERPILEMWQQIRGHFYQVGNKVTFGNGFITFGCRPDGFIQISQGNFLAFGL